ncbi:MAG TPA: conjugal transfer protein MobC [Puia sp.]|nr:conjugal transfer protein MobC [Puia sp.]
MQTGENEQGLRKILDMSRMISLLLLILHIYFHCYHAFRNWGWTGKITDRILLVISQTGFFSGFQKSRLLALGFLIISLLGAQGKKDQKINFKKALIYILTGLLVYFPVSFFLSGPVRSTGSAILFMGTTAAGYLLMLTGGILLSRIIRVKLQSDVFNTLNETFPQEERLLRNEYSINLPARYNLKGCIRKSWINIINPFRGVLVIGSPGAGKSFFVMQHVIRQHIRKGFGLFVYDFKFDDLSKIAYEAFLQSGGSGSPPRKFYTINFEDLSRSHRCNPLDPSSMLDITDAIESSRTILLGLNREWIRRQGDFFVESPINFLAAIIWFLRKYRDGIYCSLPHIIELMQVEYDKLFTILKTEPGIEALINPFITAYINDVMEQLEGQMASAKIAMARLASPQLYYVLSGNDFTLDLNNPSAPKIICMGSNPQKQQVYGAVLSLYISRLIKLVNKKGGQPCSLIFDEFPTIYLNGMDILLATARSNKVATFLAVQDFSQLKKDYGRDQAEVIMNIMGNVISGQATGETARQLSERFGRILQDRFGLSINSTDTSLNRSRQLGSAIPASTMASLSSGEFVGMVADNPLEKIELKTFHCQLLRDHSAQASDGLTNANIPVINRIDQAMVMNNYYRIRTEVQQLVDLEMERILNDPVLAHLIVKKFG